MNAAFRRACSHCGERFTPTRPLQAFCRPSCRLAHFKVTHESPRLPLDDYNVLDERFEDPSA